MLSRKAPFPSLITRNSRNHMILMKGKIGIMIRNYMQLQLYRVICGNLKVHVSRTPPWDSFIDYNLINSFNQPSYYDSGKRNCISIILFSDMPKLFCCEPLDIDARGISRVSCHALVYVFFLLQTNVRCWMHRLITWTLWSVKLPQDVHHNHTFHPSCGNVRWFYNFIISNVYYG